MLLLFDENILDFFECLLFAHEEERYFFTFLEWSQNIWGWEFNLLNKQTKKLLKFET